VTAAREAKRADDLRALRQELQRLQKGVPIPATDEPSLPAVLKRLREDYRQTPAN
jgi:hypothetical protein